MSQLGVVIPTRNSEAHLARHLTALQAWLDLADEVVVVDSESTDRTLEMLRANLHGPRVRFLSHPPGLYASWNHGIRSLGAKWTYLATVGDTITRAGIRRLLDVAKALNTDVVCSSPRWVKPDGSPITGSSTPIIEMADELGLSGPALMTPPMLVAYCAIYALARGMNTPLCSSASNLYRTTTLAERPFPTDHGSAGDAFWLLLNASCIRYALVPEALAEYLAHSSQHGPLALTTWQSRFRQAAQISGANAAELQVRGLVSREESDLLRRLLQSLNDLCDSELALERMREGVHGRFWALLPTAWLARRRRNRNRRASAERQSQFVAHLRATGRAFTKRA